MAKSPLGRTSSGIVLTNSFHGTSPSNSVSVSVASSTITAMGYCMMIGLLCCVCNILYISYSVMNELHSNVSSSTSLSNESSRHNQQRLRVQTPIINRNQLQDRQIQTLPQEWQMISSSAHTSENDPIRQLLIEALGTTNGKEALAVTIDDETLAHLPSMQDVSALYGPAPVVLGLESCNTFQNDNPILDAAQHLLSVAGSFNTGTNLLAELLIANCYMPERLEHYKTSGIRWQVLWGKHTPVDDETFRQSHRTYANETGPNNEPPIQADAIFPAVTIRDPYKWMQSVRTNTPFLRRNDLICLLDGLNLDSAPLLS
jgi:hypothetical protein